MQQPEPEDRERGAAMFLSPIFIQQVKDKMKENNWTQRKLAEVSGISRSTVNRIVMNEGAASTLWVSRLAQFLKLDDPSAQLQEPEIQRWVYIGMRLRESRPAEFAALFKKLEVSAQRLDALADTKHVIRSQKRK